MPYVDGVYTPVHVFQQEYAQGQRKIRADYMDENFSDLSTVMTEYLEEINTHVQEANKSSEEAAKSAKAEVDKAISPINTKLGQIDTHLSTLDTTTSGHTTKISALETTVGSHTTDIANIKTKNTSQDTEISNIKTKNTSQDTEISNLKTTVSGHTTTLNSLTDSLGDLQSGTSSFVKTTGAQNVAGVKTFTDNPISKTFFGKPSAISASAINVSSGACFTKTITADTTFTISGATSSTVACFCLVLTNGGAFTVTWPTSFKWTDGEVPELSSSGVDVLTFMSPNGGTTWYGTLSVSGAA